MIETDRLLLRPWDDSELPLMVRWNADPVLMQHFGATRTPAETEARFRLMQQWQQTLGFSFWALERKADGQVIGNCGLKLVTVPWPEPTDIEIGWMLVRDAWGQGYATEAATAALAYGLTRAPRVMAMTTLANRGSWRVMERIGMERRPELDFDHPEVPEGSPHRPHIVYVRAAT
jgi:RimJ/RimL family protein N-acetyltransferase